MQKNVLSKYLKENRKECNMDILVHNKDILDKFIKSDSIEYPGLLLTHKGLSSEYNELCSFITSESDSERIKWLKSKKLYDKYIKLFERIYKNSIVLDIKDKIKESKREINTLLEPYKDVNIQKYFDKTTTSVSSKIKNEISLLVKQTGIDFDKYYSALYDIPIHLHIVRKESIINTCIHRLVDLLFDLKSEEKFILNTFKQLHLNIVEYILDIERKEDVKKKEYVHDKSIHINKNWSSLDASEQSVSFKNYSIFYINTIFINEYPDIIPKHMDIDTIVDKLYSTIVAGYNNKLGKSSIKWNKKEGRIDKINNISFNLDTMLFIIQNTTNTNSSNHLSIHSTLSTATINNEILKYLYTLERKEGDWSKITIIESDLYSFFKKVYRVKKLSKSDKIDLYKKTQKMLKALVSIV